MTEPTHECTSCLATTIQYAVEVAPPHVLGHSTCPNRPGNGHMWVRRTTEGQQTGKKIHL